MNNSIKGKVALVTGGSSGIGRAVCLKLAEAGAKVVLASRRVEEGEETAQMIRDLGAEALFVQGDISSSRDAAKMVQGCVDTFGELNIACNNAGIEGAIVAMIESDEEEWDEVIDINLKGTYRCMKAQIKQMVAQGTGGSIVNISSIAGLIGFPGMTAYSATKHALIGLTKTAAQEYAPSNIRINVVCPGLIDTAMADRFTGGPESETEQFIMSLTQMRRRGTPEEVADAIMYLSANTSSYVTGSTLVVDGGALTI